MKTFLEEVADTVLERFPNHLGDLCMVFPGKRAFVFTEKYIRNNLKDTSWAPQYTTISELMESFSDFQKPDQLKLIFQLYHAYCRHTNSTESFDSFYYWGETLLSDFDDIDKNVVNAKDLFTNIKSLKSIEDTFSYLDNEQWQLIKRFWDTFKMADLSDQQQEFIKVWKVLYGIYNEFTTTLRQEGLGYEGLIYRNVSGKIHAGTLPAPSNTTYVFIGFNALSKVEHELFQHLQSRKQALFFWDYHQSYIDSKYHEAGRFMRENIRKYPSAKKFASQEKPFTDKKIGIIACTGETQQARIIPGVVKRWNLPSDAPENTAIVLTDEKMLMPVLNNLPTHIDKINVTMGFPVNGTTVHLLLDKIMAIAQFLHQNKSANIHFSYLAPLLSHPYAAFILENPDQTYHKLVKENKKYIALSGIYPSEMLKQVLLSNTTQALSNHLLYLLKNMAMQAADAGYSDFEMEQLYTVYTQLNRLNDIIQQETTTFSIRVFGLLLKKIMKQATVSFVGEPLGGLQVMGILETRALDFDNLIVLGLNEGTYPKTTSVPTFIPQQLRRAFGLPTPEYQDAIYAYYFYRLLQRAKNVDYCYNADMENASGEISRFLKQLKYHTDIKPELLNVNNSLGINARNKKVIEKTGETKEFLSKYLNNTSQYLSPSALNTFADCSLKFYYTYFLGLREPDAISDEIDAMQFGNILHNALELVYKDEIGKELDEKYLAQLLKNRQKLDGIVNAALDGEMGAGEEEAKAGNRFILEPVVKKYLYRMLEIDKAYAPFTVVSLEQKYQKQMSVQFDGRDYKVNIGGKIDRIDKKEGLVRIIDYKTGAKKSDFKDIQELFWRKDIKRPSAVLQVLLYCTLFSGEDQGDTLQPHLVYLRNIFEEKPDSTIKHKVTPSKPKTVDNFNMVKTDFEENFQLFLNQLFDINKPFVQTDEVEHCNRCEFNGFCWK